MIGASGRYTAPAPVANPLTITVTATSVADPSKFASAMVTVMVENSANNANNANLCKDPTFSFHSGYF
jgi:hypothetical protein